MHGVSRHNLAVLRSDLSMFPFHCLAAGILNVGRAVSLNASAAIPAIARRTEEALTPAEYAVISTPTGQQLVEEGKWFALSSEGASKASLQVHFHQTKGERAAMR